MDYQPLHLVHSNRSSIAMLAIQYFPQVEDTINVKMEEWRGGDREKGQGAHLSSRATATSA